MNTNLKETVENSFSRYAGSVILDRAICDARDMLKPSSRMLMYSQRKISKNTSDKPFVKCARIVGNTLGSFYCHGDEACYKTYMRMAKPFAMRYPLEDCQGNTGTVIEPGDEAAMRYTEIRPSKISNYLFNSLEKDTIKEWKDNFDETLIYPAVLPSIGFYNIVNGTTGIGISLSSSIPQFNLREVNNAIIKLINNPNIDFDSIYCAPDFATGCIITNAAEVKESIKNGKGASARIRAKITYLPKNHSLKITELPYGVYVKTILNQLENILETDENDSYGIKDVKDASGSKVDCEIELTKEANPSIMIKKLYKDTSLESHFTINMVMLDKGRFPKVFGWKEALQNYISHITECQKFALQYDYNVLLHRNHILDGLKIALAHIDEVVKLIRNSESAASAETNLIKSYGLDEEQAKAILDMKLQRLANLEAIKVNTEYEENVREMDKLQNILSTPSEVNKLLIAALQEVSDKFGDARRTQLENSIADEEEEPEEEEVYIQQTVTLFKVVKRGMKDSIKTTNLSTLGIVTKNGKFFKVPVASILEVGALKISSITKDDPAVYVDDINEIMRKESWCFLTHNGTIKKTLVSEYNYYGRQGSQMIKLRDGDSLEKCGLDVESFNYNGKDIVMIDFPTTGKAAFGTKLK